MSYLLVQIKRTWLALKDGVFWAECLLIIPLSMLGIWWPVWFKWTGYTEYLEPAAWFTFGIGSIAAIIIRRSILSESRDNYKLLNTIFILFLGILSGLFYGKSLTTKLDGEDLSIIFWCFDMLDIAITLNILVWLWHFISIDDYDDSKPVSSLGESYD
ncbi:hypothetical protein [Salinimonas lutimaris]|uniref:hypothetical protein n=1 Tax=Salinimonas lutimaris TaxID=914153 RepID=UPI0010BFBBE3|nr:hypothetical protein [Salinimonas lutimaris]